MTRINANLSVKLLSDEHLLAEHREIKRIPDSLKKAIKSGSINKIPNTFRLGTGHVLFFINKLQFVYNRYIDIHNECLLRGFAVEDYSSNFISINDNLYWNDWKSSLEANLAIKERIIERVNNSTKKCFHYYGKQISKNDYIKIILNGKEN